MHMQLQNIDPHPLLKGYIEKMWLFESSGKMPTEDMKLIVPNGRIKLAVTFRNGVESKIDGKNQLSKENSISLAGFMDVPYVLDIEKDKVTGTLGVEFSPLGAYRFFHLPLKEIKNQIHPLTDILGNKARQLEEYIANAESVEGKIGLLQQFLLKQFFHHQEDAIFEYCIEKIITSKGKITVHELERKTGYSSRWLNMKFIDNLGVSPKNLSSIIRFKQYYQSFAKKDEVSFMKNEFYDFYYDQSHFIKDFKRFTGLTYSGFDSKINHFGTLFYKE